MKSASIDSLTASIQCDVLDDVQRGFGARQRRGVDQCGQSATPRIRVDLGQRQHRGRRRRADHRAAADPAGRHRARRPAVECGRIRRRGRPHRCPLAAVESPHRRECHEHATRRRSTTPRPRDRPPAPRPPGRRGSCRYPAVRPRSPLHRDRRSCGPHSRRWPPSPSAARPGWPPHATDLAFPRADRQQPVCAHRFVGPFDMHPLRFGQIHDVLDQSRGRIRQHHLARRRHRFHPLRKPDRLARRGIPKPRPISPAITRPEFRPTRNRSATPSRRSTSAASWFASSWMASAARHAAKSMILQCNWGAEQCHHPVSGVLDGPAESQHDSCRPFHEFGHELAQPLDVHRGGELHRPHHVGEQHCHLPVLRRVARNRSRGAALIAELGILAQPGTA